MTELDRLRDAVVQAARGFRAAICSPVGSGPEGYLARARANLDAALAALDAHPTRATAETVRVAVRDWQPIVTAPRDGTRFIAWWPPSPRIPAGMWRECQWYNGTWYHPFYTDPSHWQPAPTDGPQSQEPGHE